MYYLRILLRTILSSWVSLDICQSSSKLISSRISKKVFSIQKADEIQRGNIHTRRYIKASRTCTDSTCSHCPRSAIVRATLISRCSVRRVKFNSSTAALIVSRAVPSNKQTSSSSLEVSSLFPLACRDRFQSWHAITRVRTTSLDSSSRAW